MDDMPEATEPWQSPPPTTRAGEQATDRLSRTSVVPFQHITPLTSEPCASTRVPILGDGHSLLRLIEQMIRASGVSESELARRCGVQRQTLAQYRLLYRRSPSVPWLVRLVQACGARIYVELPSHPGTQRADETMGPLRRRYDADSHTR